MSDYDRRCVCGTPDHLKLVEEAKWPTTKFTWFLDTAGYQGALTRDQLRQGFAMGLGSWAAGAVMEWIEVSSAQDALLFARFAPEDGPGGTLAKSELADNTMRQKRQWYDSGDVWSMLERPSRGVYYPAVVAHEVGHWLGLTHDPDSAVTLMDPTYNSAVVAPTAQDFRRLYALGYQRREVPVPPPVPGQAVNLFIQGNVLKVSAPGLRVEAV